MDPYIGVPNFRADSISSSDGTAVVQRWLLIRLEDSPGESYTNLHHDPYNPQTINQSNPYFPTGPQGRSCSESSSSREEDNYTMIGSNLYQPEPNEEKVSINVSLVPPKTGIRSFLSSPFTLSSPLLRLSDSSRNKWKYSTFFTPFYWFHSDWKRWWLPSRNETIGTKSYQPISPESPRLRFVKTASSQFPLF